MAGLHDRLTSVLGGRTVKPLEKAFGMVTIADLLQHYPRRYETRGDLTDLSRLDDGDLVTVVAQIVASGTRPMKSRPGTITEVIITDGARELSLTFFNLRWADKAFHPGRRGLFAGHVSTYHDKRQLTHPMYELFPAGAEASDSAVARMLTRDLVPLYPATSKVPSWTIAGSVAMALDGLDLDEADDPVPAEVRTEMGLVDLATAYEWIHRPDTRDQAARARVRLSFDEAWIVQAMLASRRADYGRHRATARAPRAGGLRDRTSGRLPFALTAGQRAALAAIETDLAASHPMHRLLQGEVGSGKTVVALLAMLAVVDAGGQAALLAPTEVLAGQHARTLADILGPAARGGMLDGDPDGTRVALLTGSQPAAVKRAALLDAVSGTAGIVVGTHALLSDPVRFHDLGLIVIDEQHRFGVEQRAALALKAPDGTRPHVLVMTATPIPRTVALTVFGDLDVTTLAELPGGRAAIASHVVDAERHPRHAARMWERIAEEVAAGRQAYIVCPRIGGPPEPGPPEPGPPEPGTTDTETAAVLELAAELAGGALAGIRIGVLHGRLAGDDKNAVMRRFAAGPVDPEGLDVLVATTVVEVGLDVPNATVMVVMDADRFGVSQLHQLRGRVGRGSHPGLCLLHTHQPPGTPARSRLDAVAATLDGFALARLDLEQRREGDVLGVSQSGRHSTLRLLSVLRDEDTIVRARDLAERYLAADPGLERCPALRAEIERWEDGIGEYVVKS